MHIIQRPKGIDPRAKTAALHGHVEILLKDATTGKIKDRITGDNMLTNGLDSALNKCPLGLNKVDTAYSGVGSAAFQITPLFSQILGGVLLFPQTLGDDPDLLFPPFSNSPTGMASMSEYIQTDSRQGSFDAVGSGKITGGYKYSYGWGPSYGNGTIASIGLSTRNAHTWCFDGANAYKPAADLGGYGYTGYYRTMQAAAITVVAMNEKGVCVTRLAPNYTATKVGFFKCKPYRFDIFQDLSSANALSYETDADWLVDTGVDLSHGTSNAAQMDDTNLYIISRSSNTFTVKTYALADGSLTDTSTYTFSGASFGSNKPCIANGYIYCSSSTAGKIYKCNMSNTADITEISNDGIKANERLVYTGSNWIYGQWFILDISTGIVVPYTNQYGFMSDVQNRQSIVWEKGMWIVSRTAGGTIATINAHMKQWGLMSHYDLANAVTKDATKTMTVNYSITQQ